METSPIIKLSVSAITPAKLVKIAFSPFADQFSQKDVSVELNLPHTLPPLECDIAKTAWVLSIFFSNAVRYTPQWGSLLVKANLAADTMRISVENSGYGVPMERLQRMFQRDEDLDSPEFGQGLALLLAREIIEVQQGKIGASSELGVMTQFYINLPIKKLTEA